MFIVIVIVIHWCYGISSVNFIIVSVTIETVLLSAIL